jgi:hypothetical protein
MDSLRFSEVEGREFYLMRRSFIAGIAVGLGVLAFSSIAGAITYGSPDGNGHPEVGALLAPVAYSDGTWATCSGTLISPTVFLTAAHIYGGGQQDLLGHVACRSRLQPVTE